MKAYDNKYEELNEKVKKLLRYKDLADEIIHKEKCTFPCTCGLTQLIADIMFLLK